MDEPDRYDVDGFIPDITISTPDPEQKVPIVIALGGIPPSEETETETPPSQNET